MTEKEKYIYDCMAFLIERERFLTRRDRSFVTLIIKQESEITDEQTKQLLDLVINATAKQIVSINTVNHYPGSPDVLFEYQNN